MSQAPRIAQLAAATLAGAALGGGGLALASGGSRTIHGCVVVHGRHELLIQRRCTRDERTLSFNQRGPAGPRGKQGASGTASDWATILMGDGSAAHPTVVTGQGITAQRVGVGDVQVTALPPCAGSTGAISVTPESVGAPETRIVAQVQRLQQVNGNNNVFSIQVYSEAGAALTAVDGQVVDVTVTCQ